MTIALNKSEVAGLLQKMQGGVSEKVKKTYDDQLKLPSVSDGVEDASEPAGAILSQAEALNVGMPGKVADAIGQSVAKLKETASSKKPKSQVSKEGLQLNTPLKEGTPVTYTSSDGTISNTYVIVGEPIRGGFGITYKATRGGESTGELVVLKEFHPDKTWRNVETGTLLIDEEEESTRLFLESFKKEPERIVELKKKQGKHLSIADMYRLRKSLNELNLVIPFTNAFKATNGNWYYVMEFVPGNSLFSIMYSFEDDRLAAEAFPLDCRLEVMRQLCNAIINLHSINCVHQDLSPSNVMVNFDNGIYVKVIDYGLATTLVKANSGTLSKLKEAGTPGFSDIDKLSEYKVYYSKEQKDMIKRMDVYSLGAILGYLCLLRVKDLKQENFGYIYAETLKKDVLFYPVAFEETDDVNLYVGKLRINLIKQLVHDSTCEKLEKRIPSAEEFSRRLLEIISVTPEAIIRMNLMEWAENDERAKAVKAQADRIKSLVKQDDEEALRSLNLALVKWKDAEELRAEVRKQAVNVQYSLDTIVKMVDEAEDKYGQAAKELQDVENILILTDNESSEKVNEEEVFNNEHTEPSGHDDSNTVNTSTSDDKKPSKIKGAMQRYVIAVLIAIISGVGGYYIWSEVDRADLPPTEIKVKPVIKEKEKPQNKEVVVEVQEPEENIDNTPSSSVDSRENGVDYLNYLMPKANGDQKMMQELKESVVSNVKILVLEGETLVNTDYSLKNLYSSGNKNYIIGKTHRVEEVEYSGNKISAIILGSIN